LNFKRYSNGDEKDILDAFKIVFERELSIDYWKWRYVDNPNGDTTLINIAWDENKLAAHYALSPVTIFVNGIKYNSALSMSTFTHPDYLKRGLFTKLAENLYLENMDSVDVIFGVPNDNSVNGFIKKLGFKLIKEIPMLESKILNKNYKVTNKCVFIYRFEKEFDELFFLVSNKYNIITSRDSKYLNWRFIDNPENKYQVIAYIDKGRILGYAVIKIYDKDLELIGDIVDIIAINELVLRELINSCFSLFQSKSVLKVNTWFFNNEFMSVLKDFNFKKSGLYFYFIVKNNSGKLKNDIFDFNNWYLTMSDIDIF